MILWKLSGGDLSKASEIEKLNIEQCYEWYYMIRVKELNEMKVRIAEWKKIKR